MPFSLVFRKCLSSVTILNYIEDDREELKCIFNNLEEDRFGCRKLFSIIPNKGELKKMIIGSLV